MTRSVDDTDLWVRRFHPAPSTPTQLVCFPHAGGSASFYFPLSRALATTTDVLTVQYPGRQDRRAEPCFDSVTELADAVTEVLLPTLDRPVALFGHSMGASLAFEVAMRMERRSVEPVALFVSGRRAPSRFREENFHLRDDDTLLREVARLSGTDSQVLQDEEVLRMVLPAIRGDYRAAETYRFVGGDPLHTPIHAHTGESDPKAELDDVRAWSTHTTGRFTMTTYPGGHFYLSEQTGKLTDAIAHELLRTVGGTP